MKTKDHIWTPSRNMRRREEKSVANRRAAVARHWNPIARTKPGEVYYTSPRLTVARSLKGRLIIRVDGAALLGKQSRTGAVNRIIADEAIAAELGEA